MKLNEVLDEVKKFVNKNDDDLVDKFNNRYTVILLAVFMVLIAGKQYYGDPITWLDLIWYKFVFIFK